MPVIIETVKEKAVIGSLVGCLRKQDKIRRTNGNVFTFIIERPYVGINCPKLRPFILQQFYGLMLLSHSSLLSAAVPLLLSHCSLLPDAVPLLLFRCSLLPDAAPLLLFHAPRLSVTAHLLPLSRTSCCTRFRSLPWSSYISFSPPAAPSPSHIACAPFLILLSPSAAERLSLLLSGCPILTRVMLHPGIASASSIGIRIVPFPQHCLFFCRNGSISPLIIPYFLCLSLICVMH